MPMPQPVSSQTVVSTLTATTVTSKPESSQIPPTSILKPGGSNLNNNNTNNQQRSQPSPPESNNAPPPPERGSSFAVMSMRAKETTKRVSFNDASVSPPQPPPSTLQIEETIREDPNVSALITAYHFSKKLFYRKY